MLTGKIVGYDPGGNDKHGLAILSIESDECITLCCKTLRAAEDVIRCVEKLISLLAIGADTLTVWSTSDCGWRPADCWLRCRYRDACRNILAPNSLSGAMVLNGVAVLTAIKQHFPHVMITETHPKVLYRHLAGRPYHYEGNSPEMDGWLENLFGVGVSTSNQHEWDAAISAFAALKGLLGQWPYDLHTLSTRDNERLIWPVGPTHYFWPDATSSPTPR